MDHLSKPQDPLPFPEFPVFGKAGYDHEDFRSYPGRCGLDIGLLERHKFDPAFDGKLPDEIAEFIQNWFYFGFLEFVLGAPVDAGMFITTNVDGIQMLTTAKLPQMLLQWAKDIRNLPRNLHVARLVEVQAVVIYVRRLHGIISSARDNNYDSHASIKHLPETLLLSISILGTTLSYAVSHVRFPKNPGYETSDEAIMYKSPGWWPVPRLRKYFEGQGWCPNDLVRMENHLFATGFIYAVRLRRSEVVWHGNCTQTRCIANDILPGAPYHCKHTRDGCDCPPIGPSIDSVMEILDSGQIPVLELSKLSDAPYLRAIPYNQSMKFVAISHVWSDGLGNPYANTIPKCRASWFYNVLYHVYPFEDAEQSEIGGSSSARTPCYLGRTFYFWLDTLCIPLEAISKRHRDLAIKLMARTYNWSHIVLVLDSELQQYDCRTISTQETLFRILCSGWMRRVWTIHEAVLSKRLIVLFGDDVFDVDRAVSELRGQTEGPDALDPLMNEACRFLVQTRAISYAHRPVSFALAWSVMQARQTSIMGDEAICFANMLRLDPTEILKLSRSDTVSKEASAKRQASAMKVLFSLLEQVPEAVLWNLGPRLLEDGYRWAPSSFHGGFPVNMTHKSTRRDENGLHVVSLGLLLYGLWRDPDINRECSYEVLDSKLHFELIVYGKWHQVKSFDRDGRHPLMDVEHFDDEAQLGLIADLNYQILDTSPKAALVSIKRWEGTAIKCRYERLVRLRYASCCANAERVCAGPHVAQDDQDGLKRTARWTSADQEWHVA